MIKFELSKEDAQEVVNGLIARQAQIAALINKLVEEANTQLAPKEEPKE